MVTKVPVKIDCSTFHVHIPVKGSPYTLTLQGEEVVTIDLKAGIIKLFHKCGFILNGDGENIDDELVKFIKKQPPSFGQRILLSILDNPLIKRTWPAYSFKPDEPLPDEQGILDNPPVELDTEKEIVTEPEAPEAPKTANVTVFTTPIKPPYHRRNQPNLFDSIIENTIIEKRSNPALKKREKSTRAIVNILEKQGIKISPMTVSRRTAELIKEGKIKS